MGLSLKRYWCFCGTILSCQKIGVAQKPIWIITAIKAPISFTKTRIDEVSHDKPRSKIIDKKI